MVLDTSAVMAILGSENDADRFETAIAAAERVLLSTGTLIELGIVVEVRLGEEGGRELDLFLLKVKVRQVPVSERHAELAREAYRKFGKGRHRAGLNFGDCFSYALAMAEGEPLLFKGADFSRTDVPAAIS
jgi:ribonuclease VapC